jgi:hypothetical protein
MIRCTWIFVAKSTPRVVACFENMVQHHLNSLRLTTRCAAAQRDIVAVLQKEQAMQGKALGLSRAYHLIMAILFL